MQKDCSLIAGSRDGVTRRLCGHMSDTWISSRSGRQVSASRSVDRILSLESPMKSVSRCLLALVAVSAPGCSRGTRTAASTSSIPSWLRSRRTHPRRRCWRSRYPPAVSPSTRSTRKAWSSSTVPVDAGGLSGQLRFDAAHPGRRWRSAGCAGADARAVASGRADQVPPDRRAADDRRRGRRREDHRRADRQDRSDLRQHPRPGRSCRRSSGIASRRSSACTRTCRRAAIR